MNVQSATAIANYYQQSNASSALNVAQALSAIKVNPRAKFTLQDTATNIENNFTNLAAIVNNVNSVTLTDVDTGFITITAKQLLTSTGTSLTKKMNLGGSNKVSLNVIDALAKDIATLKPATSAKIGLFSIKDTTANISAKFDSLAAFETKLGNVQLTDPAKFVKITNAQYEANSNVRNHFIGTFGFEVSGVSTSQALDMATDNNVSKVNILDHAQNIADNLDALQDLGLKVNTIKSDDPALFKVSADQLKRDGAVIGKIYKGYQLAVFNIDAGTALSVKSNKKIVSLDIVDTAEGISKNLALLGKLGTQLHSLQITDGKPLFLTAKAYFQSDATLKKVVNDPNSDSVKIDAPIDPIADPANANFNNTYQLDILDSTAVDAIAIKNNPRIHSISIKDTSAAISANLNSLNVINDSNGVTLIKDINVVGNNNLINLTTDQLTNDDIVVSLLKTNNGNLKFNVRGVAASEAKTLLNDPDNRVASVSVSDTAENIVSNLSDLASLGKNLSTIIQTDARVPGAQGVALDLSANEWMLNIGSLSKIVGGYGVNLKDVGATKALSLANDVRVKSFEVLDSAAQISSNFDTLKTLGSKLTSIKQSDSDAIEITGRQYGTQGNILNKLEGSYQLTVKNAQANQVSSFVADKEHINSVQVLDTVDNITGNLLAIQDAATPEQLGSSIKVSMSGTPKPFTLTVADLETYQDALKVIQDNYKVNLTNVEATEAKAFVEDDTKPIHSHLLSMTVKASAQDLSNKDLVADLNSLGNKISQVNQKDVGELISISQPDWETNRNLFAKINGYQVSLSEVTASGAKNVLVNEHVANVKVVDTGSQISLNFGTLMGLGPSVTTINQTEGDTSNLQLSMELWKTGTATLSKIENDYKVDLLGSTASDASSVVDDAHVNSIAIKDSPLEISSNFDGLTINDKISHIVLSGPVAPIRITQTQLTDGSALLGKVQGAYTLAVSDATFSGASDLLSNTHVVSAEMSGSSSDVSDSLSVLSQLGPKLKSLSLTDDNPSISLSFTNFQKYKNVLGLIPQNLKIDLTEVKASDAVNSGLDIQFNLSFSVKDSAAQIASNIDGLAALKSKLSAITSNTDIPVLTLKASQYLANQDVLAKVNTTSDSPYKLILTGGNLKFAQDVLADAAQAGKINTLDITDSAENISNNFDVISNIKVSSARLTAGATTLSLSGADYAATSTLAKVKGSFDINVNNASKNQASALDADSKVSSYSLDATTTDIGNSLPDLLDANKLTQINITQDSTKMSVSLTDYVLIEDKLSKLVGSYGLNVTGVTVSDLESLEGKNEVSSIQISDSSEHVSENWDTLMALGDKLKSIDNTTPSVPVAITYDQFGTSSATIAKLPADQTLALLDVQPGEATDAAGGTNVATISVNGTAGQVASNFESLVALGDKLDAIEINDSNPLELTQDQFDPDIDGTTIAKIRGSFDLVILE
jgi:hypothetical protein